MKSPLRRFSTHPDAILGTLLLVTVISTAMAQTAPATTSWTPIGETNTPRPDYSQLQYWMMAPQDPTAPVDVLFIHTTTFKDTNYVDPGSPQPPPAAPSPAAAPGSRASAGSSPGTRTAGASPACPSATRTPGKNFFRPSGRSATDPPTCTKSLGVTIRVLIALSTAESATSGRNGSIRSSASAGLPNHTASPPLQLLRHSGIRVSFSDL